MTLPTRKRFEVMARDNFMCRYCGRVPPHVVLHVDHIYPKSKGGGDDYDNLVTACAECNMGKAAGELAPSDIFGSTCPHCHTWSYGREVGHTWDFDGNKGVVICPLDEVGLSAKMYGYRKRICYNRKHWRRHSADRHYDSCQVA